MSNLINAIEEIEILRQEICAIDGVEFVRVVLQNPPDLHAIIFSIRLGNLWGCDDFSFEKSQDIWKQAHSKVYQTCKYLRDTTKEKWYFRTSFERDLINEDDLNFCL